MPELAELKLTSDYVNGVSEGKIFTHITKNPDHKWKDVDFGEKFYIKSSSRGKEIKMTLISVNSDKKENLMMTMGMGGHFKWASQGESFRNTHLFFHCNDGGHLAFVDVRRFGKWKWGDWNKDRGPDPTTEYFLFCNNILQNLHKRAFDKPIYEVLMNQRYFNGIGNYLRAEILIRIPDEDPFQSAREFISKRKWELFELCKDIPILVYEIGGGTLKDWKNPFGEVSSVRDFMKCYGNPLMEKIEDRGGRMFWYDPKWKN
jgi:endonuclease VIII-like 1